MTAVEGPEGKDEFQAYVDERMLDSDFCAAYADAGASAQARARASACDVPDWHLVRRCVVGDDQGRTTFHYDDGRDPWVLPGMREVEE